MDGFARIDKLFSSVKEKGMHAVAITDHGTMFGAVSFFKKAKESGVKPIIGIEVYVAPGGVEQQTRERNHLILLAKNEAGYRNLCKLCTKGFAEGFYYKPRVDLRMLRTFSEGIVCLSGCKYGSVSQALLSHDLRAATASAEELRSIFGEDFYLEMQMHGDPDEVLINRGMVYLSKQLGIPVAATNDVHYIEKSDAKAHDILLCIQTNKRYLERDRMKFPSEEFYLKGPEEMAELFAEVPEAIENTVRIAEKCEFEFRFDQQHLPKFVKDADLRVCCEQRLRDKIAAGLFDDSEEVLRERLEYELKTIGDMGYSDYMLIVQDFIDAARKKGIAVGPGRGSAGGSLVAYLLDITEVNPMKHHLIFERFLNPERVSMPDIDVDFEDERRSEVIDYVRDLYGHDHVSHISTFGTLAARAAIRDVGRVLDIPNFTVDKLAREIPAVPSMTLDVAREENPAIQKMLEDEELLHLYELASELEGIPRHVSTHAAGVVITERATDEYMPLYHGNATQYTMNAVADLGLLKMDFLGIRTLSVVKHAVERIVRRGGLLASGYPNPLDEPRKEVFELLQSGNTIGLFQLESTGFRRFIRKLKPRNLEDIVAAISLYRPGPMQSIPTYLANRESGTWGYAIPELAPILDDTCGVVIYQEQVMRIARDLAGYSYGRSDVLRNAMSKKKREVMEREKPIFIDGMVRKGIDAGKAAELFEELTEFAKYAFNKTHAVGYSILAYRTAYLKTFYPLEFMAALLTSVQGFKTLLTKYIGECKRMGIRLLPPCVNRSTSEFEIEEGALRWSFVSVKHVGVSFADALCEARGERPFRDFYDFAERMPSGELRKNQLEALILVGAFDSMGYTRTQLMGQYEGIVKHTANKKRDVGEGQLNFFSTGEIARPALYPAKEFRAEDKAAYEKEYLGVYLSDHPLDPFAEVAEQLTSASLSELRERAEEDRDAIDGERYRGVLYVNGKREQYTKKGDLMAFLSCEDGSGEMEVILFPKVYRSCPGDAVIYVEGVVQSQEGREPQIAADRVMRVQDAQERERRRTARAASGNLAQTRPAPTGRTSENGVLPNRDVAGFAPANSDLTGPAPMLELSFSRTEKQRYLEARRLLEECRGRNVSLGTKYRISFLMKETNKRVLAEGEFGLSERDVQRIVEIVGKDSVRRL